MGFFSSWPRPPALHTVLFFLLFTFPGAPDLGTIGSMRPCRAWSPPPQKKKHSHRGHRLTPALQQRVPRNLSQQPGMRSVTRLILRDGAGTGSGTVYPEEIKICILVWKLGPLGRSRFQTPTLPVNFLPDVFWTCPAGVRTLDGHKTRSKDWVLNPDTFP